METAAVKFVEANPAGTPINDEAFDKACGVGIEFQVDQLPGLLKSYISSLPSAPEGWTSLGPLMGGIKSSASDLKYAYLCRIS